MTKYIIITALLLTLFIVFLINICGVEGAEVDWDRLVQAVIVCESGGDSNAVSKAGCIGLMQVNPKGAMAEYNQVHFPNIPYPKSACSAFSLKTNKRLTPVRAIELTVPGLNIEIGTWYLKRLKDHYLKDKFTIERMLACYNWGYGNVRKVNFEYDRFPKSVKNYIKRVLKIYNENCK